MWNRFRFLVDFIRIYVLRRSESKNTDKYCSNIFVTANEVV